MNQRFVIIGGDAAGMSAAMQIRRSLPEAEIIAFEMGGVFSYAQCGLPYFVSGDVAATENLIARTEAEFNEKYRIQAKAYHEVTAIHPETKEISVTALQSGNTFRVGYDKLLIATGGSPVVPEWPGIQAEGVFTLKTVPDAHRIKDLASSASVQEVVIVGGGYIGLEMAEAFHLLGKKVTLLQRGDQIAGVFDKELADEAQKYMQSQGIDVVVGQDVTEILQENGRVNGVNTDKGSFPAQLVLISIGISPNSDFAEAAGIKLGVKKAIAVNRSMETNIPDIYAAGDCATQYHRIKQQDDYIPLGTTANKQGRLAGSIMAGEKKAFGGIVGSAVLKILDFQMARTGLSEKEAQTQKMPYDTVTIQSLSHAGYYPEAKKIQLKLVYRKDNHLLLGGQAVGFGGVAKRIDVLAAALYNEMTLEQLEELDLTYAPPFNSSWDPIQQAARVALK